MLDVFQQMNKYGAIQQPYLFILDFEGKKPLLFTENDWQNAEESPLLFDFEGINNTNGSSMSLSKPFVLTKKPCTFEHYKRAFDDVKNHILQGNSFLVNLTQPTSIEVNYSLEEIFYCSNAKYKLLLKDNFVCFSPETFLKIDKNGLISTFPMKGTIDAALPDAQNLLLHDRKEKAEHYTIVDLLRNDLSLICEKVWVEKFRFVEQIETHRGQILQTSSEIKGQLPTNFKEHLGTIFKTLLPAGSISGAPKNKTIEIIQKAEGYERGYYTGVAGYFDGQTLNSSVLIRYVEKQGKRLIFKSGGGITAYSDAATEYEELINKVYVPIARNPSFSGR